MTKYEGRNSVEATVSNSFACPPTKLTGAGSPGGILGVSSDGDDRMERKVKTQKNP